MIFELLAILVFIKIARYDIKYHLIKNIDLIIGGHTHTFLPKPTISKNSVGENVLVNQVGCYGLNVGRIDFYFDSDKNLASKGKSIIV